MHLLSTSSQIYLEKQYPYEVRYIAYLGRACNLIHLDFALIGIKPSFDFDVRAVVESKDADIHQFYEYWRLFTAKLKGKNSIIRYVAEKSIGPLQYPFLERLNLRTLYLIRDPRDIILSVNEFNKRRNHLAFSWQHNESIEDYARKMMPLWRAMLDWATINDPSVLTVRYEDLILDPQNAIQRLNAWLNLDLDICETNAILSNNSLFSDHRISKTSKESVFKWKEELDSGLADLFEESLRKELRTADYPLRCQSP